MKITLDYFPNHPELFPIVYNINGNGIELEKLETKKAEKEFESLNKWFKKNFKITFRKYLLRNYTSIYEPVIKIGRAHV